jgi:outer membrane protein assembly factor BamB
VNTLKRFWGPGLCCLVLLMGCSSTKSKPDKPVVLVPLVNKVQVKRVWQTKLPGDVPIRRLGLDVAVDGNQVFAAGYKGVIEALDLKTGKRLWQRNVRAPLTGGPAAGEGLLVIGTEKGEVIALAEQDGAPRWRVRINAEILSAAAIGGGLVVVRAVDGKMHGLAAADGKESWVIDQQVPRLSLRGTSRPILVGDLAICGFDNGRVVAVARNNGTTAWDTAVGQPHGSTELRRLIDVDAQVEADGDDLFAVAYQGRVTRLVRDSGQIVWGRDLSSNRGLVVDADAVFVATADGDMVRLDRNAGTELWRQKGLERRQLSAPTLYGGRVVVGDFAGVLNWLDLATGDFVARVVVGKHRISNAPLVAGDLLLVFSDDGELSAYRAPALGASATGG